MTSPESYDDQSAEADRQEFVNLIETSILDILDERPGAAVTEVTFIIHSEAEQIQAKAMEVKISVLATGFRLELLTPKAIAEDYRGDTASVFILQTAFIPISLTATGTFPAKMMTIDQHSESRVIQLLRPATLEQTTQLLRTVSIIGQSHIDSFSDSDMRRMYDDIGSYLPPPDR